MSFRLLPSSLKPAARLVACSVVALTLAGCATNPMTTASIGTETSAPAGKQAEALGKLAALYKKNPTDKATVIYYASALRANGQSDQAVAVLEKAAGSFKGDVDMSIAYAKALAAAGSFSQALNIIERAIDPTAPNWSALLVKGAILDQSGRNGEARKVYGAAIKIAPDQASLRANLGLSYAMTNELDKAEAELRAAVALRGANTQVRQNLALVVGLQGRFDEARQLFAAELPPDRVEANMAYIKSLLTQQNRWDLVKSQG